MASLCVPEDQFHKHCFNQLPEKPGHGPQITYQC